jgi:poly-gamma-glutamate synthesis protein (capsule biosynthesis protein)
MAGTGDATQHAMAARTTISLAGDVMIGRGVDQILSNPSPPTLHEAYIHDAHDYVRLAERASGPIPFPAPLAYVWGDALQDLRDVAPDARIVNLETALTRRGRPWPEKGIHYRASPENARCLAVAGIDACALANNHVLDWGHVGLADTLETLAGLGIAHAGAGRHLADAEAPAVVGLPGGGRLLLLSLATVDCGVPPDWAADDERGGVHLVPSVPDAALRALRAALERRRRPGDLVVASVHWGPNWGHAIPDGQRRLAHWLVDELGAAVVHGHSSHHAKAIEVHHGHLVLYGCGDLLTDYEGISGHEAYRGELGLLFHADLDAATGALRRLRMTPTRMRRLQITRASPDEARWLAATLTREGRRFHTRAEVAADGRLALVWA